MKLRVLLLVLLGTAIAIPANYISVDAQTIKGATPTVTSKSARIELSIAVPSESILIGQKLLVSLTVKNLGRNEITYPAEVRVHVEGDKGEPPTTLRQRQIMHRLKPGEQELLGGGFEPSIAPGAFFTRKYDLSELYEIQAPGKYTVYVDVLDETATETKTGAGLWVRSPVATFKVRTPPR